MKKKSSVVIPVYRNEANLPRLLSELERLRQKVTGEFEVVLVVGGSPDFFFSSRRRHTRCYRDWSFRRVLFRSRTPHRASLISGHPQGPVSGVAWRRVRRGQPALSDPLADARRLQLRERATRRHHAHHGLREHAVPLRPEAQLS